MSQEDSTSSRSVSPQSATHALPAGAPAWVTADLIERTIRVWQRYYAVQLTTEDALVMILNVAGLIEVFSQGDRHETIRCLGSGEQS